MSSQLLIAKCCCGGAECEVYTPCQQPGGGLQDYALLSAEDGKIVSSAKLDAWWSNNGCVYQFSGTNAIIEDLEPCREGVLTDDGQAPPSVFVSSGQIEPSGALPGFSCGGGTDNFTAGATFRATLDSAGEIESASVRSANFGVVVEIEYPDTTFSTTVQGGGSDYEINAEVVWFLDGPMLGASVTITRTGIVVGEFRDETLQANFMAGPFLEPLTPDTEVCDIVLPAFTQPDPPEWFDPGEPGDCPLGCQPGPVGFVDFTCLGGVGGVGDNFGPLPTEEEWPAALWLCSTAVITQCPNGCRVRQVVPCGFTGGTGAEDLCNQIGPIVPGAAVQSSGCSNCGNGGVL